MSIVCPIENMDHSSIAHNRKRREGKGIPGGRSSLPKGPAKDEYCRRLTKRDRERKERGREVDVPVAPSYCTPCPTTTAMWIHVVACPRPHSTGPHPPLTLCRSSPATPRPPPSSSCCGLRPSAAATVPRLAHNPPNASPRPPPCCGPHPVATAVPSPCCGSPDDPPLGWLRPVPPCRSRLKS